MRVFAAMLLVAVSGYSRSSAQVPVTTLSDPFQAINPSVCTILQLPNGNTALYSGAVNKKSFDIWLWNKERRLIGNTSIPITFGPRQATVFTSGNDIVVVQIENEIKERRISLHKYRVSGQDGKLLGDSLLHATDADFARMDRETMKGNPRTTVAYRFNRDQSSGAFAFCSTNWKDEASRLNFYHYGSAGNLLFHTPFTCPDKTYTVPEILDLVVEGDTAITVLTAAFDPDDNDKAAIYLSHIAAGGTKHLKLINMAGPEVHGMLATDTQHAGYGILVSNDEREFQATKRPQKQVLIVDAADFAIKLNTRFFAPAVPDRNAIRTFGRLIKRNENQAREIEYSANSGLTVFYETMDILFGTDEYYHLKGVGSVSFKSGTTTGTPGPQAFKAQSVEGLMSPFAMHEWLRGELGIGMSSNNSVYTDDTYMSSYVRCKTASGTFIVFNARPQIMVDKPELPLLVTDLKTKVVTAAYTRRLGTNDKAINIFNVPDNGEVRKRIFTAAANYNPTTSTLAVPMEELVDNKWVMRMAWLNFGG